MTFKLNLFSRLIYIRTCMYLHVYSRIFQHNVTDSHRNQNHLHNSGTRNRNLRQVIRNIVRYRSRKSHECYLEYFNRTCSRLMNAFLSWINTLTNSSSKTVALYTSTFPSYFLYDIINGVRLHPQQKLTLAVEKKIKLYYSLDKYKIEKCGNSVIA